MRHIKGGVYQIICKPTGQRYIGCALKLDERRKQHLDRIRTNKHPNVNLRLATLLHGVGAFEFAVIQSWESMVVVQAGGAKINSQFFREAQQLETDILGFSDREILFNVLTHKGDKKNFHRNAKSSYIASLKMDSRQKQRRSLCQST